MKFIFEVKLNPGFSAEEYAANWVEASRIIQQTTGARGTRLHRKIGAPDTLLAIASWETKEARDAKDDRRDHRVREILSEHEEKCVITVIGEFEEPEWEVLPGD
ncbi:MAG: antibiotic biosynthesis monooxygenase [Porticoccaceae bacterium]|nr:antibiotic biosynthesis monooxygenase [Porticoccaceae bacterium]